MNISPKKGKRVAFMISAGIDALMGGILLLIGFNLLPVDLAQYGLENWQLILFGGILFIVGMAIVGYNLSRLEE